MGLSSHPPKVQLKVALGRLQGYMRKSFTPFVRLGRTKIDYSWNAALYQGFFILLCGVLFKFGAPPGIAVACLAVAAIVMAFRLAAKDFKRPEQLVWIALSAFFLYAEINAITSDKANAEARELRTRIEERIKFQTVIDQGIALNKKQSEELAEQRQKFAGLLLQGRHSIKDLGEVATSVVEATSYASGGSSYPVVFPYEVTLDNGTHMIGFGVTKRGKYPLFDLQLSLGRPYINDAENYSLVIPGARCKYPELNDNGTYPALAVSMNGEDSAYFSADVNARNGAWNEVIDVRRVGNKLVSRWVLYQAAQYSISPAKVVLDLADQDFPLEHRHDVLHPIASLAIPNKSQMQTAIPDVIFRPTECQVSKSFAGTITIGK